MSWPFLRSANKISKVEFCKLTANGFPVMTRNVRDGFWVTAGMRDDSSFTKLKAKYNSMSYGNWTEACQASSLFLDKLSFLSLGIVAKASNIVFGETNAWEELNSLLAKLSSSNDFKYDMSLGKVHKSFEAKFKIKSDGKYCSIVIWAGGIRL